MTAEELRQHRVEPLRDRALGPLYIPRRFTVLPESGNLSSDLEFRAYGMLLEREPTLKEVLTHPQVLSSPTQEQVSLLWGGPRWSTCSLTATAYPNPDIFGEISCSLGPQGRSPPEILVVVE
jgi:hypothetical protein